MYANENTANNGFLGRRGAHRRRRDAKPAPTPSSVASPKATPARTAPVATAAWEVTAMYPAACSAAEQT
jgi:hypothetical protein